MNTPISRKIWLLVLVWCSMAWFAVKAEEPQESKPATESQEQNTSAERINKLIRQLGDKDYFVRQKAQEELAKYGFEIFDALNAATKDEDLEIASRAKYLLRLMRVEWTEPSDSEAVKQCLHDYQYHRPEARENTMRALASLPNYEGVGAIGRLVRFEKSPLMSKEAALALFTQNSAGKAPPAAAVKAVRKSLGNCTRPAAQWLMAWTQLGEDPKATMAEWSKFIEEEQKALKRKPVDTTPDILARLVRYQVAWLKQLGQTEAAVAAMHPLFELENGDPDSLADLVGWLIDEKAWKPIDELNVRFTKIFSKNPTLLYLLAEAQRQQGQEDKAKETAQLAFSKVTGDSEKQLLQHFRLAHHLYSRGQFDWARREYEHVAKVKKPRELAAMAHTYLAEMLHDQGKDDEAAATVQKIVQDIDSRKLSHSELLGRTPEEVRARAWYFQACHWKSKGDVKKQQEYLDKALEADPEDVDVLIAAFHLPDRREKAAKLIRPLAEKMHEDIDKNSEKASAYNQYAWLVGNTEGNLDEALRCSLKSLELQPDEPGYLDTLAHVYFTKGDYAKAVEVQEKAIKGDPHSGALRRALKRFREKLNEKKQ